ncbi:MAG: sigma-70 family RNA polymerase sigma factor [Planctomycetes bacterium]|nr:sigma-70 family RNA polymerase sigma factor [Planctomycetota bacterium]MCB9885663.1 sigma-70 family RNA polymerase sigma factor [Planctomycetota bacterium]
MPHGLASCRERPRIARVSEASPADRPPITQALQRLAAGHPGAADQLLPLVYDELRRLASSRLVGQGPGQTVEATALVHEAWLRLGGADAVHWDDRAHFFGAAARAMRFILVDHARHRARIKRGGDQKHEPLPPDVAVPEVAGEVDVEALDLALTRFEEEHPRPARLVMLRYFGGLPMEEIAKLLQVSLRTAERDWLFARSWLRARLEGCGGCGE